MLLNIRSSKGAVDVDAQALASGEMGDAVAAQVDRVWSEGVISEASKVVRMTRMIGAEKNTDFYKMATSVGSTVSRLDKVTPSRSRCSPVASLLIPLDLRFFQAQQTKRSTKSHGSRR